MDPQLITLRNYGGATQTVGLMPNSPAIDAADPVNYPATDQRGIARPQDGDLNGTALPDIGAYERQVVTLTVTKTADANDGVCDSDCSLREAVGRTHAALLPDYAILFDPTVFSSSQTIVLLGNHLLVNNAGTLLIAGTGRSLLTISGNDQVRTFFNQQGSALLLRNLTLTDGFSGPGGFQGGVIYSGGAILTLIDVVVRDSTTTSSSGGVYNVGSTLNVIDSLFEGNSGSGGGAITTGDSGQLRAVLNITNSIFRNNRSASSGGAVEMSSGSTRITGSLFEANAVTGSGNRGGAISSSGGDMQIHATTFAGNTSSGSGGALSIGSSSSSVSITEANIHHNTSFDGGAIRFDGGTLNILNSAISSNSATGRGGGLVIYGGVATITSSTFYENSAGDDGGGIGNFGTMTLSNSTITNNRANDSGGGFLNTRTANVSYTTISNNTAQLGGGVANSDFLQMRSTLIADNFASNTYPDFYGTFTSQGYNLIENLSGTTITGVATGNVTGSDPKLGASFNYGGPTPTRSLLPGSPAIDAADPGTFPNVDQRGISRPIDGDGNGSLRADIGPEISGTLDRILCLRRGTHYELW